MKSEQENGTECGKDREETRSFEYLMLADFVQHDLFSLNCH